MKKLTLKKALLPAILGSIVGGVVLLSMKKQGGLSGALVPNASGFVPQSAGSFRGGTNCQPCPPPCFSAAYVPGMGLVGMYDGQGNAIAPGSPLPTSGPIFIPSASSPFVPTPGTPGGGDVDVGPPYGSSNPSSPTAPPNGGGPFDSSGPLSPGMPGGGGGNIPGGGGYSPVGPTGPVNGPPQGLPYTPPGGLANTPPQGLPYTPPSTLGPQNFPQGLPWTPPTPPNPYSEYPGSLHGGGPYGSFTNPGGGGSGTGLPGGGAPGRASPGQGGGAYPVDPNSYGGGGGGAASNPYGSYAGNPLPPSKAPGISQAQAAQAQGQADARKVLNF